VPHARTDLTPEMEAEIKEILASTLPLSERFDGFLFDTYDSGLNRDFQESITEASPYPLGEIKTPVLVINAAIVRLRHLLNQNSGLPASSGEIALADFDNRPGATERQACAINARVHPPGRLGLRIQQLELQLARADHRGRQW
jgi:hypothetical protein